MIKKIKIEDFNCICVASGFTDRVAYLLYPAVMPFKEEWLQDLAMKHKVSIVVVYIPSDGWNDLLTPWPEPGETPDSPPFAGKSVTTMKIIEKNILPETEKILNLNIEATKDLFGVSLSGLFTLWQWLQYPLFDSITSLSGSFWYPGFLTWFEKQTVAHKTGKAYFLLGIKEPKAWIKEYRSVGVNTETIVDRLNNEGVPAYLQWVPGDHFADPLGRLELAFSYLYSK